MNKINIIMATALVTTMAVSGMAISGQEVYPPVRVSNTSISGSIGTARNSNNTNEFIGCASRGSANDRHVSCGARDASGTYKGCFSRNASVVDAINGITDSSFIFVNIDSSRQCSSVNITSSSSYEPK